MTTLETVQEMLIAEFDLAAAQVVPEAKLVDLGIDSLATLEFLETLAHLSEPEEKAEDAPTPAENIEALIEAGTEEGLIDKGLG